jgi:tetratricopeptide (TPR) repeat protein
VLYELDQLYKKIGRSPQQRRQFWEQHPEILRQRDDLYIEYIWLLNQTGEYEKALELLTEHNFHPWEGGEGKVTGAYVFALTEIAKQKIKDGDHSQALEYLSRIKCYPENLGEGKLHGCRENDIHYYMALAYEGIGDEQKAKEYLEKGTEGVKNLSNVMFYNDQPPEKMFYQGLAFNKLGKNADAKDCFDRLLDYGQKHLDDDVKIDYFAVSLPDFLIFDEDLNQRNKQHCQFLIGLGHLGLGQKELAQKQFDSILETNPAHIGALVHKKLCEQQFKEELTKFI